MSTLYLRTVKSNGVEYLQLAHNERVNGKPRARVIHGFGRKDRVDVDGIRRLISSLSSVLEPEEAALVREGVGLTPAAGSASAVVDGGIRFITSKQLGGVHLLDGLWRQLELATVISKLAGKRKFRVPVERLLFALVAHRALEPGSKLSLETWFETVHIDGLETVDVQQLYRVMDFLLESEVELQRMVFHQARTLLNLEVDLVFVDTTSTYFEIENEDQDYLADDAGDADSTGTPGLRRRSRHSKGKRPDVPQAVIGLAVTKEGIPVRSWTFPGNTSDQNLVERVKDDLGSWQLGKVVMVLDSGFNSKRNRDIIRASGGDFIIGEKLRLGPKARAAKVLTTPGRYKNLPNGLRIKDVTTAGGTGYGGKDDGDVRRFIIVHNPEAATRDAAKRADIVAATERRIASLPKRTDAGHTKAVCALTSSTTFGRYIKELKGGRLIIDKQKIERDARLDGKYLISTNNDTLPAEDIANGYKQLYEIERLNRDLKHTVDVRPVYHHKEDRIRAHVTLCWLALLLIRIAENATGQSWLQIKRDMRQLLTCEYSTNHGSFTQTNDLTTAQKAILDANNIEPPDRILAINPRKTP